MSHSASRVHGAIQGFAIRIPGENLGEFQGMLWGMVYVLPLEGPLGGGWGDKLGWRTHAGLP